MRSEIEIYFDEKAYNWDKNDYFPPEVKRNLLSQLEIKPNHKILDIGCGTGVTTFLLSDFTNEKVTGIDLSGNMIKICKEKYKNLSRVKYIHKDVLKKLPIKKYDLALIYNAYPHFKDPAALAKKLYTLLNKDGRFAIVHSFSIEKLNEHHKHVGNAIAREIVSLDEEEKFFKPYFEIIRKENNSDSIFLVGKKK